MYMRDMQNDDFYNSPLDYPIEFPKVKYQNESFYNEEMVNYEVKGDETHLKLVKRLHNNF